MELVTPPTRKLGNYNGALEMSFKRDAGCQKGETLAGKDRDLQVKQAGSDVCTVPSSCNSVSLLALS